MAFGAGGFCIFRRRFRAAAAVARAAPADSAAQYHRRERPGRRHTACADIHSIRIREAQSRASKAGPARSGCNRNAHFFRSPQ